MPSLDVARAKIAELSQRASGERRRAARAAAIATEYEARLDLAPTSLRELRLRMIELHRRLEGRHLQSARLQELHAVRLERWTFQHDRSTAWPTFIEAIASAIGRESAGVTLIGRDGAESFVAASDQIARIAHDVEFVTGEGPAHDVVATRNTVHVEGDDLLMRWPRYGAIAVENGVRSVISHPLRQEPGGCIGALSVFDATPVIAPGIAAALVRVADALTHTVLNVPGTVADDEIPAVAMFDEADFLAIVHQAAGVVSVQLSCKTADAVALLRARAFSDGLPLERLARRVINGDVRL